MDGQLLLRFRFPDAGVHHPDCDVRRHRHGILLLPALRRRLQLVSIMTSARERREKGKVLRPCKTVLTLTRRLGHVTAGVFPNVSIDTLSRSSFQFKPYGHFF